MRTIPGFMASVWHGMTFGVWLNLLIQNRFSVSPSRLPLAASVTLTSIMNSGLAFISKAVHDDRANRTSIRKPPLFLIGHWRTGTTLVHELMMMDDQFNCPNTYQCVCPHHFPLTGKWLPAALNWTLPTHRVMDNMRISLGSPQERSKGSGFFPNQFQFPRQAPPGHQTRSDRLAV
jgi:hypothetical protein